ncbi:Meiosis expressed protein [Intoshia linei]|uniref:Meiosis expressed protein n=1 Tax=Intoshia linei TaxID=1819745 RepID=A0A177B5W9_9BILA|nr:Meiosis expressed protein [Intoshia linei]
MANVEVKMIPISMKRPKVWNDDVEEAYRFQLAGYRDSYEYTHFNNGIDVDRWQHNGYVKKLVRKGLFNFNHLYNLLCRWKILLL